MKIHATGSHQCAAPEIPNHAPATGSNKNASFASVLNDQTKTSPPTEVGTSTGEQRIDFTNMTRQELLDWVNDQLRREKMTFEESSSFLAMTISISKETGQPVDMETDTRRFNFIEIARGGLEGALSRNDREAAESLQNAMGIMNAYQDKAISSEATA